MSMITYDASLQYLPNGVTVPINPFAYITELEIEAPEPVIVDMSSLQTLGVPAVVLTGEKVGGFIRIAFWLRDAEWFPEYWSGTWGYLELSASSYSYSSMVLCRKASLDFRTGSAVKGSAEFVMTSYPYLT